MPNQSTPPETLQFAENLRRAHDGDSWQGPSIAELLVGVTAAQAAARPIANAHGIWELVLHLAAWHRVVRRRIAGETLVTIPDAENFPSIDDTSEAAWAAAKGALHASSAETVDLIRAFPIERLDDEVPGKGYAYRHMLSGVAAHDAYHSGQIALLKKMNTRREAGR